MRYAGSMARFKDAFLVNLWFETTSDGDAAGSGWRGSVEHLASRRRLYFTALGDLVSFLSNYTASQKIDDAENRRPG